MQGAVQANDDKEGTLNKTKGATKKYDEVEIDMNNLHEVGKKINGSQRLTTF